MEHNVENSGLKFEVVLSHLRNGGKASRFGWTEFLCIDQGTIWRRSNNDTFWDQEWQPDSKDVLAEDWILL